MQISDLSQTRSPLQQRRFEEKQEVQSVFSAVLESVGREGYESAAPTESAVPLEEQIQDAWDGWYQLERIGRYRHAEAPAELGGEFAAVIDRAYREGGYADPKRFLNTLSKDELKTVQNVHWLAESIDVNSLSEEGALNLLIPPAAQVDLNRDGLTQSGLAYGIRFPDSTTPKEVAVAFEDATAGLSEMETSLHVLHMKMPVLLANIHLNADGTFSHQVEPGDPEFRNPMLEEGYSYSDAAQSWIEYLDYFQVTMDTRRYESERAFWTDFQSRLPEGA
ncbi:hypothetical protein [Aporhodopirellula aestuarii]|uniref:Uncharacterized protein n=1 Tax=Aporhodopirellula aestuarii TaxID=2950107 RepID=A0ABT0U0A1_9BACT|nr:hypothetical protein [Aporhodopirellula aestuarii]MCM2370272.1 hypothetical protein [Aporhodopirellula aestuarii]